MKICNLLREIQMKRRDYMQDRGAKNLFCDYYKISSASKDQFEKKQGGTPDGNSTYRVGNEARPARCKLLRDRIFTLIELLIVITIITILAGTMLPALSRARGVAKLTVCTENLKQIGVAQSMYSSDYQDWIVPNSVIYGSHSYGTHELLSNVGRGSSKPGTSGYGVTYYGNSQTKGTFVCPAESIKFGEASSGFFEFTHYGFNTLLCGITVSYSPHKQSAVFYPSSTIFGGDNERLTSCAIDYMGRFSFRHGGINTDVSALEYGTGKSNMVYMDGHVSGRRAIGLVIPDQATLYAGFKH